MRSRIMAFLELVLILPAVLFMTALVLRELQPLQYGTRSQCSAASHVVRGANVDVMVSVVGAAVNCTCQRVRRVATQLQSRHFSPVYIAEIISDCSYAFVLPFIAATTLSAGVILAVVVLHVLANKKARVRQREDQSVLRGASEKGCNRHWRCTGWL